MWYKNYYTWFLTWGLCASALVVPVGVRWLITGKTAKRKPGEDYLFYIERDRRFQPNGNVNLFTGLDYVK